MPTPTRAKPPVPAWIIRERKRLGLKPRELAERLTAMSLPVTEGTVRTWEAGRNPHPDNVEGLERIFGSISPANESPTADQSDLAAAIRELTAELRAAREEREGLEARLRAMEAEIGFLGIQVVSTPPERSARRVTTG